MTIQTSLNSILAILEERLAAGVLPPEAASPFLLNKIGDDLETLTRKSKPGIEDVLTVIRDHVRDTLETEARSRSHPAEADLYPTVGEMVNRYNSLLSSLLTDPKAGIPYLLISVVSPGDSYFEVTIPESLRWIFIGFSAEETPRLWVNREASFFGISFLKVISAACTGIEGLLDVDALVKNPSFIVSENLIKHSHDEESWKSRRRRFAMQMLSPIFSRDSFHFRFNDVFYQGKAVAELAMIPSAARWHRQGSRNQEYLELVIILSLILERMHEIPLALNLIDQVYQVQPDDERLNFHKARLLGYTGAFDEAIGAVNRAIFLNGDREYYKKCRANLIEKIPITGPFSILTCPDLQRTHDLATDNLPDGEDEIFIRHMEFCPACSAWYKVLMDITDEYGKNLSGT